jgi:phospholipid/cholesterol/gamma-HCH transport system permease protein
MATVGPTPAPTLWSNVRNRAADLLAEMGEQALFVFKVIGWSFRRPARGTFLPVFYNIGVNSVPVVCVTGLFIGAVLAVQAFGQFASIGMKEQLGGIVNASVVRELGPVLAATMLAGRVGSAMAAELATMRVTEQIDALACLGSNPLHHLVVPRFLACVLLIPLLTILADFMGVMGGALITIRVFHVDAHHYWVNAQPYVRNWDLTVGLIKPMFFGGAIALIACYRGFNSEPGAEGVGRAATAAFVRGFIAVLALDFFLALFLNNLYDYLYPV